MVTLPEAELRRRAARLRLVLTDCDGVLTDAGVYYSERGEELRRFSVRDGMGVERLALAGVATGIISGERSGSILRRADKLGIVDHVLLGIKDKRRELGRLLERTGLAPDELAYIGDDVNDLEAVELVASVGLTCAPADADPRVLALVHHRAATAGGHGAFRDFVEWILDLRTTQLQGGPI